MNILLIDLKSILKLINSNPSNTRIFETYYDICRVLEIQVSKEACFRLFTRYSDSYGKLKEYLCLLGKHPDKKRFDEEFFRRYKQIYFNGDTKLIEEIKGNIKNILLNKYNDYFIALISVGNNEFSKYTVNLLNLSNYLDSIKISETLDDYNIYMNEIISQNTINYIKPEKIILSITNNEDKILNLFSAMPEIEIKNIFEL